MYADHSKKLQNDKKQVTHLFGWCGSSEVTEILGLATVYKQK